MRMEETAFLSTFKVALVLVHLHSLVLSHVTLCHVTALVQIGWPRKYILHYSVGYCRGADLSQKKPYRNDTRKPSNKARSKCIYKYKAIVECKQVTDK
jgi:hypothetical protein